MVKKLTMKVRTKLTLEEGVEEFMLNCEARNLRPGTITLRKKAVLNDMSIYTYGRDFKTILRFFMKKEWIPQMELSLPKADKVPTETYTNEQLKKLLKKNDVKKCGFTEYKCWVMVNFLLSTGIRQNSLVNIRIGDIDFDTGMILIKVTKNRKPLVIPMNKEIN